jgi:hypothetical protein
MKNMVVLQKLDDGSIYCQQLNEKGIEYIKNGQECDCWEEGGTITLDELPKILSREV